MILSGSILALFLFIGHIEQIHGEEDRATNSSTTSTSSTTHDEEIPEKFFITHEAWFNISISEDKFTSPSKYERIVIGLFGDICPMTVTNFITITKGLRRGAVRLNSIILK